MKSMNKTAKMKQKHTNRLNRMNSRHLAGLLTVLVSIVFLFSCGTPAQQAGSASVQTAETRIFVDSVGREVEVPVQIDKVAVSGALAQMYVFAIAPDKLCGVANGWSDGAKPYIDEKYLDLPALGQLYGAKGDLNVETIMSTGAQIIIDVGETKEDIASDMDDIQEQINIPTVHIAAYMDNTADAFRMLGDLLGMDAEGEALAQYCSRIYSRTKELAERVDKVDLLYLDGDLGQNVMAKGSYHAEIVDMLSNNLAEIGNASGKGLGNEADMEQLLKWNPDYIIFAPQSLYEYAADETEWQNMKAIMSGNYYEVPYGPYNWMGQPPGCNRYLGMIWMAKLLYPDEADYDLYEDVAEFYRLFIHTELTEDQYEDLVANSIGKRK